MVVTAELQVLQRISNCKKVYKRLSCSVTILKMNVDVIVAMQHNVYI